MTDLDFFLDLMSKGKYEDVVNAIYTTTNTHKGSREAAGQAYGAGINIAISNAVGNNLGPYSSQAAIDEAIAAFGAKGDTGPDSVRKFIASYNSSPASAGKANKDALTKKADDEAKAKADQDIKDQEARYKAKVESETNDPNSSWNKLNNLQTTQLTGNLDEQQKKSAQMLINQLAAQGIDPSGGAYAGGQAAINEDIAKLLTQGTNTISQETVQGVNSDAQQLAQSGTGFTQANREAAYGDIATQLANEYQQRMADEYYANMQKLANQNQGSVWDVIGTGLGAVGGGFAGAAGGPAGIAAGITAGAQVGRGLGRLIR